MFTYTAFEDFRVLSQGTLEFVALAVKRRMKAQGEARILIFSDSTGRQIDLDLSGTDKETTDRLQIYAPQLPKAPSGVGRPKLGVVPREISLLPQHWEWLTNQEGGASPTIRRLIAEKMNSTSIAKEKTKVAQEVTYKFLTAIAGDLPNFEEAIRFLYRKDQLKFEQMISGWHKDLAKHARSLSKDVFN